MTWLSAAEVAAMQAAALGLIATNPTQVQLRRGETTLPYQTITLARQDSRAQEADSAGGQEMRSRIVLVGSPTLDVQPGDRFNDAAGQLYRVTAVHPDRRVMTQADAELIQ